VYQPVSGDFQIVARLAGLTPNEVPIGPLAGLMIRENMTPLDRFFAVAVVPQSTLIVHRRDYWGRVASAERADTAATWLKVVRHESRLRAYTSADGKAWSLLGAQKIEMPERVFVGMCAMCRDKQTAATATFDNVEITLGPPAMTHAVEGVLFRCGTFLASEALSFKDGALAYNRGGKRVYLQNADVARMVYKPVPAELASAVPAGTAGALVASGDFVDGELKEITWRVTVSNLVLGPRTLNTKAGDVLAVYVKDADEPALRYVIHATDGSIYQAKAIAAGPEMISFEDPALGAIELPIKELGRLDVRQ
jgi:uncharacterized membrane protein